MTTEPLRILCFGELLWDLLPHGKFPGGAPANVGYHLHQLGAQPRIVSAVGNDELGHELTRRVRSWGLDATGIAQDATRPTGTVTAQISPTGEPNYTIARDVAWDFIPADKATLAQARSAHGIVFGSLAQRSDANRAVLDELLAALPATAERIFDINLRAPHDDLSLARAIARKASLLKLNLDEALRLTNALPGVEAERCARDLARATGCQQICITLGAAGAGFLQRDRWYFEAGRPVKVHDTIGAGDAFLAGFLAEYLRSRNAEAALRQGCRLGEWVASQPGATPTHPQPK